MNNSSKTQAFTLVEVIIGIMVLSIVMFSITVLTITVIQANQANINKLTAYYLAQESLEGMRNVRDSNWSQNHSWNSGGSIYSSFDWGADFDADGYYTVDYQANGSADTPPWTVSAWASEASAMSAGVLYRAEDSAGDLFYVHDTTGFVDTTLTPYSRYLALTYDPVEDIFQVTAIVFWEEHNRDREVQVSTQLSDWREGPI